MPSVYKRSKSAKSYTIEVKVFGVWRRLPGFIDAAASAELGRKVERLAALRESGEQPDGTLRAWRDSISGEKLRRKLIKYGVLDGCTAESAKPLTAHIADFRQALRDRGATAVHIQKTSNRVEKLLKDIGVTTIRTLTPDAVSRYLAKRRGLAKSDGGLSVVSSNNYAAALKIFCNWLVDAGRAAENPVAKLQFLSATDRKHVRRALEIEEVRVLLAAARNGEPRFGMSGEARSMLYKIAVETGLRSNELRSLTRASFEFGDAPTVTVAAAHAKNRTAATLPLRPETAAELRTFLAGKLPAARVFRLPRPESVVVMLRGDLKAAGIEYRDESGRVVDFHALRSTFATLLLRSGADIRTAKELMRHSSITQTGDIYACTVRGAAESAISRLPSFSTAEAAAANGTDGRTDSLAAQNAGGKNGVQNGGYSVPVRVSEFTSNHKNSAHAQQAKHVVSQAENAQFPENSSIEMSAQGKSPQGKSNPCLQDENLMS